MDKMKYWRTKKGRSYVFLFGIVPLIVLSAAWEPFLWVALALTLMNLVGTIVE